jgi:hypothetical protein
MLHNQIIFAYRNLQIKHLIHLSLLNNRFFYRFQVPKILSLLKYYKKKDFNHIRQLLNHLLENHQRDICINLKIRIRAMGIQNQVAP